MSVAKDFEVYIQRTAGTYLKDIISIYACNVDSVDADNRVCDCTPIGGDSTTSLPDVQLCSENNNGFIIFPKVNSTVIVAISTRNTAFVLMYSDIDKVQFMDGSYGGMVYIENPQDSTKGILKKINNLENLVNDLIGKYNSHVHPATLAVSGSSATGTTSPTTSTETTTLTPTVKSDIENPLITQGINP